MKPLTPIEEFIFKTIKKGANNNLKLINKTGKDREYVQVYTTRLERKGLITRSICEHCDTGIIITPKQTPNNTNQS